MAGLGKFPVCTKNCKPRWVKGKGSFTGWRLLLCRTHQIIHKMVKEEVNQ